MAGVRKWNHLYWNEVEDRSFGAHSRRIESWLFGRISRFKRDSLGPIARTLGACGFSWWKMNQLKPIRTTQIHLIYHDQTSVLYAAICETKDAERARSVILAVNRPFVLHIWDLLDVNQIHEDSVQWLIRNARHVFCCSEPAADAVKQFRKDTSILCFRRMPASHRAKSPGEAPLRIALIGYCSAYTDGLSLLNDALTLLRLKGIETEVCYIGGRKQMAQWSHCLHGKVRATGFLHSDEARDQALAGCHVGFLPGPLAPPAIDPRSRFSIPSRILDFVATGLPCVAAVHRESATAAYMEKIGLSSCIIEHTTEQLAAQLSALAKQNNWNRHAAISREAFHAAQQEWGELAPWLDVTAEVTSH